MEQPTVAREPDGLPSPSPGIYQVRVTQISGSGPFTLHVESSVPDALVGQPVRVVLSDPANDEVLTTFPR